MQPDPRPGTSVFITGTDTGVGKTGVATGLLRALRKPGRIVRGLKPVASGARRTSAGLRNDDAERLAAESSGSIGYEIVNPYCFEPAIAPHIAAAEAGIPIGLDDLLRWYSKAAAGCDVAVVEGAGGWRVPLHPAGFLSDFAEALALPVLLVVGLRLGCLNHARLTVEAIERGGRCRYAGWVGVCVDPEYDRQAQNVEALARLLSREPLAVIGWQPSPSVETFASALNREDLLETLAAVPP